MDTHKNRPLLARARFALDGFLYGLRTERSLQTQAAVLLVVIIALVVLKLAPLWWALVILSSAAVLAAEMFNTAIEHLADHLHPQEHAAIRIVKDCAAAGVLLTVIGALGVATALLWELIRR